MELPPPPTHTHTDTIDVEAILFAAPLKILSRQTCIVMRPDLIKCIPET